MFFLKMYSLYYLYSILINRRRVSIAKGPILFVFVSTLSIYM